MTAYISALSAELLNALIVFKLCVRRPLFLFKVMLNCTFVENIWHTILKFLLPLRPVCPYILYYTNDGDRLPAMRARSLWSNIVPDNREHPSLDQ